MSDTTKDIDALNDPSAVELREVVISKFDNSKKFDIRPLVLAINLNASIYDQTVFGYMLIADSNNLLVGDNATLKMDDNKKFSIIGEEFVNIRLEQIENKTGQVPGAVIEYKFVVDRIDSDYAAAQSSGSVYKITLRSVDSFINAGAMRSKSYSGSVSEIVKSVLVDELKTDISIKDDENFEKINDITTYAFIESKPFEKIAMITQQAYNNRENFSSTFTFYESFKRGYCFETYENMIQRSEASLAVDGGLEYGQLPSDQVQKQTHTFKYSTLTDANRHGYDSIIDYSKPYRFDAASKLALGYYNTKVIAYDMIQKRPRIDRIELPKKIADQPRKLNTNVDKRSTDTLADKLSQLGDFNYFIPFADETNPIRTDNTRKSLLYASPFSILLKENTIMCKLYGAMYLDVSDVVELVFPDSLSIDDSEKGIDKDISGKYIVSAIAHDISLQYGKYELYTTIMGVKESTLKSTDYHEATDINIKALNNITPEPISPYAPENQAPSKPPLSGNRDISTSSILGSALNLLGIR